MIKIREITDEDLIPLSRYLPAVFPKAEQQNWLEKFDFWWSANPAYSDTIPRGWILEKDGAIAGFLGNIPVHIIVRGKKKLAIAENSWYLDPSVRGIYSLLLFNECMKQKNVSVFLFKSWDQRFGKILSRYNFREYILPQSQRQYIYIIDKKRMNAYSLALILLKNVPLDFWGISELFKRFLSLTVSWIFQKSLDEEKAVPGEEYVSSLCTSCDESFLSLRHSDTWKYDIEIYYDVQTMNWLYFSNSGPNKRIVIQCRRTRDSTLAGYAVFEMKLKDNYGKRVLELIDICLEYENLQVFRSLISYAIQFGKQHNIKLLMIWTNTPEIETYLQRNRVLQKSFRNYRYIRFSDSGEICPPGNDCRTIYHSLIFPPQ